MDEEATMSDVRPKRFRRSWFLFIPLFILIVVVSLALYLDALYVVNLDNRQQMNTYTRLSKVKTHLEQEVNACLNLLQGVAALVKSNPDLTQEDFNIYAVALYTRGSGIKNYAVARGFRLEYIYPVEGNEALYGVDYRDLPDQWPLVKRAHDLRRPLVAGPLELIQGGTAIIGRYPVFIDDPDSGESEYWGMVSAPLDFNVILANSGMKDLSADYEISIRGKDSMGSGGEVFYGKEELFTDNAVIVDITLPYGGWQLAARPSVQASNDDASLLFFRISTVIIGLLVVILSIIVVRSFYYRRDAATKLQQTNRQLEEKIQEISRLNASMQTFNYTVSHDLQAPIWQIRGICQIARDDLKTGRVSEDFTIPQMIDKIEEISHKASSLINKLLQFSRIDTYKLEKVQSNISMLVIDLVDEMKLSEPERKVEVTVRSDIRVLSDMHLMKIAMENLLSNAWKYTATVENARIEFDAERKDHSTVCFVRDNGVGFEIDDPDRLFQPFVRLHADKRFSGSGIGLATVARIIARHGGRIWAESEKGKGATFYFELPDE